MANSSAYLDHILARLNSDIDFLESQSLISRQDKHAILARLPSASPSLDTRLTSLSLSSGPNSAAQRSVPPRPGSNAPAPPGRVQAKANWAYNSGDPQDLVFKEGDVIDIVEETNGDWWKGRCNGREGLLPANYVTKMPASSVRSPEPPAYSRGPSSYSDPKPPTSSYSQPSGPPPWAQQPQPSYAPPQQQYQPPPPQPSWQQPQPQQVVVQEQPKPSRFGGLGNTMATAAAGGLGFGAGAAIGGDLVNAIF